MQLIDWILVAGSLLIVLAIGLYTQRYVNSVADFLSAGRVARRYLLAVAAGEMGAGAVLYVAGFEVLKNSGFSTWWWGYVGGPIGLVVAISGFVMYRYRETRAMTWGQFFEIRYSKRFRLFTGYLGFFAGLINFGIIPATGARFLVYLLGFPPELHLWGWNIPTFIPLMALFLTITLGITLLGGLITIIMTNCVEGIITQILNLFLIFGLLSMFNWDQISSVLSNRPAGQSFLNPFDSFALKDFNIWFILMGIAGAVYATGAWQNQSAYKSAPLTPHEGRMGSLLGRVKGMGMGITILLGLCAMVYLQDPQYAAGAAAVKADVTQITNPQMQQQMEIPIAVSHLLPAGFKGALCVMLILGCIGGDSNHLHSWGSILIQDAILPSRKKPLTPEAHLRLLRWSITGVALFAFLFGVFFSQTEYIMMWWAITGSIYIGGAGVAIIGGLYWKRGTAAGAWAGLLTGSLLSVGGILAKQPVIHGAHWADWANRTYLDYLGPVPALLSQAGGAVRDVYLFVISYNGQQIGFVAMLTAITVYIVVSILTCKEDFNMDRMLHRGAYAKVKEGEPAPVNRVTWGKVIGFDENFTKGDKWIAGGLFGWSMMFFAIEVFGSLAYFIHPWSVEVWSMYWHFFVVVIPVFFAVIMTVWFTWGGIRDALALFKRLEEQKANPLDDGTVVNHQNLDDTVGAGK